jgi:serine/threonine protein kinase
VAVKICTVDQNQQLLDSIEK